jgi:hypothetical protein
VYGVFLLDTQTIWTPQAGSSGLGDPPADLAGFRISEAQAGVAPRSRMNITPNILGNEASCSAVAIRVEGIEPTDLATSA